MSEPTQCDNPRCTTAVVARALDNDVANGRDVPFGAALGALALYLAFAASFMCIGTQIAVQAATGADTPPPIGIIPAIVPTLVLVASVVATMCLLLHYGFDSDNPPPGITARADKKGG